PSHVRGPVGWGRRQTRRPNRCRPAIRGTTCTGKPWSDCCFRGNAAACHPGGTGHGGQLRSGSARRTCTPLQSLTHLLPSLPARLVDGGVGLPVLVLVAFKAERIEHVLRLFDVLNSQDAAGMTPTLRILPRRFEGVGGFGKRVAHAMLVPVAVELAPRVVQPLDQVHHFPSSCFARI